MNIDGIVKIIEELIFLQNFHLGTSMFKFPQFQILGVSKTLQALFPEKKEKIELWRNSIYLSGRSTEQILENLKEILR